MEEQRAGSSQNTPKEQEQGIRYQIAVIIIRISVRIIQKAQGWKQRGQCIRTESPEVNL